MYYIILLALGALIVYLGWPRQYQKETFPATVAEERLQRLETELAGLAARLAALERDIELLAPQSPNAPLSKEGLANYQAIQEDWLRGSSVLEICRRYQLLRGEVELILGLMKEGGMTNGSGDIYRLHGNGSEQSGPGSESWKLD